MERDIQRMIYRSARLVIKRYDRPSQTDRANLPRQRLLTTNPIRNSATASFSCLGTWVSPISSCSTARRRSRYVHKGCLVSWEAVSGTRQARSMPVLRCCCCCVWYGRTTFRSSDCAAFRRCCLSICREVVESNRSRKPSIYEAVRPIRCRNVCARITPTSIKGRRDDGGAERLRSNRYDVWGAGKDQSQEIVARVTTLSAPLGSRLECFRGSKHGVAKPLFRKFIVVTARTCCNSFNLARYSHWSLIVSSIQWLVVSSLQTDEPTRK